MHGSFPIPISSSWAPAGCLSVELNSVCLEIKPDSTVQGLSLTRPTSTSDTSCWPKLLPVLLTNWMSDSILGLDYLLEWLTELRKTHLFTRLSICCCYCSVTQSLATPWTAAHQASLSPAISQSLLKLTSFESVMPSNHLVLCHLLLLLPSIFPSIRVFSKESALHIRWPKYWRFSISPSNEYSGLISFRTD